MVLINNYAFYLREYVFLFAKQRECIFNDSFYLSFDWQLACCLSK